MPSSLNLIQPPSIVLDHTATGQFPPLGPKVKVLMVWPRFPPSFWGFEGVLTMIPERATTPPLGLITVAALCPPAWEIRLIDRAFQELRDEDLQWADLVMVSAMHAQRVDAVGSDWLFWNFDRGEDFSTAPGDSGGPQFNSNLAIASITTSGSGGTRWGSVAINTRCDIHFNWMRDLVTRYTPSAAPTGIKMMASPAYAAGVVLDAMPEIPAIGFKPSTLISNRSLE